LPGDRRYTGRWTHEITAGLDRPILIGTLIGEVDKQNLITPQGANPGDRILLTKGSD
jgi:hydrogenase maturation factor